MITSTSNQRAKQIVQWQTKAKARRQDGIFLAEGLKMYEEAPEGMIREVYLTEGLLQHLKSRQEKASLYIEEKLRKTGYEMVTEEVFERMSDTRTPQGILTVLRRPSHELPQLLQKDRPLLVLLEDLQDPGNLGTILRTGEGAGITGVIMSKKTVDIYNPKLSGPPWDPSIGSRFSMWRIWKEQSGYCGKRGFESMRPICGDRTITAVFPLWRAQPS